MNNNCNLPLNSKLNMKSCNNTLTKISKKNMSHRFLTTSVGLNNKTQDKDSSVSSINNNNDKQPNSSSSKKANSVYDIINEETHKR